MTNHLLISPDAPFLVHALALAALVLHIGGASLALIAGPVALFARKGARVHRVAGKVFFVAMLTMSGIAAVVAPLLPDRFSALMGVFTFYLTATAWVVVWRRPSSTGPLERVAGVVALLVAATAFAFARAADKLPGAMLDGQPAQLGYALTVVALIAAASDFSVIRRGGLAGPPRIARHLWRMCLALFIAAGSFAGQPMAQPQAVRGSPWLFMPALAVLVLMVFWLVRIRFTGRAAARPVALVTT